MKYEYELLLDFKEKSKEVLYEGISWYTAKIVDQIRVAKNQITIRFVRSTKIDPHTYLYTPVSPVRIQLYRAACFYLSVTGFLPDVKKIHVKSAQEDTELDKARLTQHWANCRIDLTLAPKDAARCFGQDGKTCYVAITYFLKAQLDTFPHDCFRAAWSGLNALYNGLTDDRHEGEKLKRLSRRLEQNPLESVTAYVQALPTAFWGKLQWYNYIQNKGMDEITDALFISEVYQDREIYSHLGSCLLGLYRQQEKKTGANHKVQEWQTQFEKRLKRKTKRVNEQLRFLTISYCYMLRNRSFHADKPYPVFGLFDESENSTEAVLTKLLLYVIRDLLVEMT